MKRLFSPIRVGIVAATLLLTASSCEEELRTRTINVVIPAEEEVRPCVPQAEGGDSSAEVLQTLADASIADNGIDFLRLGASIDTLTAREGVVLRQDCYAAAGGVTSSAVSSYQVAGVEDIQLLFVDGVLLRIDVVGSSIESVNGLHRVGDLIEEVREKYEERIGAGEFDGRLQASCEEGVLAARARPEFRLVFEHDGSVVTRISAQPAALVSATASCDFLSGATAGHVAPEVSAEDVDSDESTLNVSSFVPDRLAGADLSLRDPTTDNLSNELATLWWAAGQHSNAVTAISIVDSVTTCLYEQDALAVGVYGGTLSAVVAFEAAEVEGVDFASCVLIDIVLDDVCPTCIMALPSGGAYIANVEGRQFVVAYATFDGPEHADAMCEELPSCSLTTFEPLVIDVGDRVSIIDADG